MGKISPVSAKYIIHSKIEIDGTVDRPDIIGAIFGQTEGLLGSELELRELQRSGRIGRIEVETEITGGKTNGKIIIPSSLDKAETCIVGAAMEIIQRIGPCNARIRVEKIEDVRISKRAYVIDRAKVLLKNMMDEVMPDSQELADEVSHSVRVMEIEEYGKDRLPAGPGIDEADEVIVVEGRADVLNMLKHGFKNVIAMNGTSVPETIVELAKQKVLTAFVDGDRGGSLILKELLAVAEIDFVTRAPDGKEVEEISMKEIHKALRSRVAAEQAKMELSKLNDQRLRQSITMPDQQRPSMEDKREMRDMRSRPPMRPPIQLQAPPQALQMRKSALTPQQKESMKEMLEGMVGTRGAQVLDAKLNVLGKVPLSELNATIKSLGTGAYAVVFDGSIDKDLIRTAEMSAVKCLIGMDSKVNPRETRLEILTVDSLA